MPVVDIIIAAAILVSMIVGFARGFVKEAMSVASLLLAIWAAFNLGGHAGRLSEDWLASQGAQLWFGRILVFVVVLAVGGLLGWGITKLIRLSVLSGMDRGLGMAFGFARGVVLGGVFVIGGQYASFDQDDWWSQSRAIPHLAQVAEWLKVMAPKGIELLQPPAQPDDTPVVIKGLLHQEI